MLALPFIFLRGASVPRLRPLLLGFWVAFLVGLGGTTPVGHWVLGRAFEVLTFERFSYWATLLALPFVGLLAADLIDRYRLKAIAGLALAATATCALAVAWSTYRPADAEEFNVKSVAAWLNRDGHDKYRYVTLGFGNKISRLAVLTDAGSVDGEWNSGRMLPELTAHGGGALTSSKYFGKDGLDALHAILEHADRYGLKWVFVRDPYYDPLLSFAGWRRVDELEEQHHRRLEQGRRAACTAGECSPDSAAVAGNDVGNAAVRQQPAGDFGPADSRRAPALDAGPGIRRCPRKITFQGGWSREWLDAFLPSFSWSRPLGLSSSALCGPIPAAAAYAGSWGPALLIPHPRPRARWTHWPAPLASRTGAGPGPCSTTRRELTQTEFMNDLRGSYPGLRTYATLDNFDTAAAALR